MSAVRFRPWPPLHKSRRVSVLLEGVHYFRPFGGRKILYVWDAIERDMKLASAAQAPWCR